MLTFPRLTSPAVSRSISALRAPRRERAATPIHTTPVARRSRTAALAALVVALVAAAACGGGRHTDTYAKATDSEQQCCEQLSGAGRDACLQQIVRVSDPEVAHSDANQRQFGCVQQYFTCDPETGHATKTSAQAQLDCIQDL